jgi:hypothetical protein
MTMGNPARYDDRYTASDLGAADDGSLARIPQVCGLYKEAAEVSGAVWLRTCGALFTVASIIFVTGCASDGRPSDHAEFAEKWINAVSHIEGQDLNCKIAKQWYAAGRTQDTCQKLFDHVQETYLGTLHYFRNEGGISDASSLKGVKFECQVDTQAGTPQDLESSGLKLPVSCLDKDGLGVNVSLDNFNGPPDGYVVYQVDGDTKFWN